MNVLQLRKKEWLSRAKKENQYMLALQSVIARDERFVKELSSFPDFSDDVSEVVQHIEQNKQKLKEYILQSESFRDEVTRAIDSVPDKQLQAILIRKYLNYETNEQIAESMFYDIRTIQRKHRKALDMLVIDSPANP